MLVGRDQEQRSLAGLLDRARSSRSGVLAVTGEAGIGKSALLAHAEAEATGMNVLRARGVQSETHIPFAGLFELLRPALGCLGRIPTPQAAALEGALALRPARARDRFTVGAATLSVLAAYSEAMPLLVLIDDAHRLDGSSADAVLFALRRLDADPIAVVLSVRDGEPSLLDGADLPTLRLGGLDRRASAQLLADHATHPLPDDVVDRLHRGTGGNPLALLELAGDAAALERIAPLDTPLELETSAADVYRQRCHGLPARARVALLTVAASDTGEVTLLARALRRQELDLADLVDAEAVGLIRVGDDGVEFRHPLVRSAIYADALPHERRNAHRTLADSLPDADIDRRAWHLGLAALGPDDAASFALAQAGDRARQRSAYEVAARAFERAARLATDDTRRRGLLHTAAENAWLGGVPSRALAFLDEIRSDVPAGTVLALDVEHLRGHIVTRLGPIGDGQTILRAAAEHATTLDPERAIIMLAEVVNAAVHAGDPAAMREAAARISDLTPAAQSPRARFFAQMAQGMTLVFTSADERGARLVRDAVTLIEASSDLSDDMQYLAWIAMGAPWLREANAGRALVDRALDVARQQSAIGVLPFLLCQVAIDYATTNRWTEAEAAFYEAESLARTTGQATDLGIVLTRLAWLEARQGREQDSRRHATEALNVARRLGLGLLEIWAFAALGDLELGIGHPHAAIAYFEQQANALHARGIGDPDLEPVPELVELYLRVGQVERASTLTEQFARHAEAKGQPWARARAARCRALIATDDDFHERFADALALHDHTPDQFETARTHLAYGARLRRTRRRRDAREQLRQAIELFDRLGAKPWSDTARAELAATGETARQRTPTAINQLTPQELQVALLLAEGRTIRQASAALFLSPKTVEYHLRNVYRKLAISSRQDLTAKLARHNDPASAVNTPNDGKPQPDAHPSPDQT